MTDGPAPRDRWADACLTARLVAVDPTLGIALRGPPGPAPDHWLAGLRGHLPADTPWRRLPAGTPEARLLGGLDLGATLAAGRLVASRGLLAEADGGLLVVASAERLDAAAASHLCAALDTGLVRVERDGVTAEAEARLGPVLLDDGRGPDEGAPAALLDRLALRLDLSAVGHRDCGPMPPEPGAVAAARAGLPRVSVGADVVEAFCAAADALGVAGLRAPILACRVARASAALAGRGGVAAEDVSAASRLVLGPRATRAPARHQPPPDGETAPPPGPPGPGDETAAGADPADDVSGGAEPPPDPAADRDGRSPGRPDELAVAAAAAALPADVLAALLAGAVPAARPGASGARRGTPVGGARQGRPVGARRGEPGRGPRLDVLATLRAAAPWQGLRGRASPSDPVRIRRDDFRVKRRRDRRRTTTIFAVDASGSAALGRLAEAKGAVELLLAECYIRRDDVALIGFRGRTAELLLPPTRSPARAKRELAGLPGGGATPLAAGIAAALDLASAVARDGRRPVVALLTDGRGNVARDGATDRARAAEDAHAVARHLRAAGVASLVIDVSPRPGPAAARLAAEMGATYLPLPAADARGIAGAVRAAAGGTGTRA